MIRSNVTHPDMRGEWLLLAGVIAVWGGGCGTLEPDRARSDPWNAPQAWDYPCWLGVRPWNAPPRSAVDLPGFPWGSFGAPRPSFRLFEAALRCKQRKLIFMSPLCLPDVEEHELI